MQSSGTSTPAGDSPGPGRAFLRKADFTPEIAPPRLRRTTYPAGQSPLVLPGLTRASSSFTITSNHQNILPLWPAAPPPGQPVVFFMLCPVAWSARRGQGAAGQTPPRLMAARSAGNKAEKRGFPPAVRQGRQGTHGPHRSRSPAAQKKTSTGMETGGRPEPLYGCGARNQNSL